MGLYKYIFNAITRNLGLVNDLTGDGFYNPPIPQTDVTGLPSALSTLNASVSTLQANNTGTNTGDETQATILTKIGYTPENTANKSNSTADSASTTKFPVWAAIVSYITGQGFITNVVSALGYTPENAANKATSFSTLNDTLYPSVNAVYNELFTQNVDDYILFTDFNSSYTGGETLNLSTVTGNGGNVGSTGQFESAPNAGGVNSGINVYHTGISQIKTGSTLNGYAGFVFGNSNPHRFSVLANMIEFGMHFRQITANSLTCQYGNVVGFSNDFQGSTYLLSTSFYAVVRAPLWSESTQNWKFEMCNGTTKSTFDTGITYQAGNYIYETFGVRFGYNETNRYFQATRFGQPLTLNDGTNNYTIILDTYPNFPADSNSLLVYPGYRTYLIAGSSPASRTTYCDAAYFRFKSNGTRFS